MSEKHGPRKNSKKTIIAVSATTRPTDVTVPSSIPEIGAEVKNVPIEKDLLTLAPDEAYQRLLSQANSEDQRFLRQAEFSEKAAMQMDALPALSGDVTQDELVRFAVRRYAQSRFDEEAELRYRTTVRDVMQGNLTSLLPDLANQARYYERVTERQRRAGRSARWTAEESSHALELAQKRLERINAYEEYIASNVPQVPEVSQLEDAFARTATEVPHALPSTPDKALRYAIAYREATNEAQHIRVDREVDVRFLVPPQVFNKLVEEADEEEKTALLSATVWQSPLDAIPQYEGSVSTDEIRRYIYRRYANYRFIDSEERRYRPLVEASRTGELEQLLPELDSWLYHWGVYFRDLYATLGVKGDDPHPYGSPNYNELRIARLEAYKAFINASQNPQG